MFLMVFNVEFCSNKSQKQIYKFYQKIKNTTLENFASRQLEIFLVIVLFCIA